VADTLTTTGSLANAVTFKLAEKTIPIVRAALIYAQFGQDGKLLPGTNILRFIKKPDLPADTTYLSDEVSNPASEALPAITNVDISTNEIGRVVSISRRAGNISPLELVDWAKDTLAFDAARRIDYECRTALSTGGTAFYANGVARGTLNTTFSMAFARKGLIKLQALDLDTTGDVIAVTHPFVVGDVMADTTAGTGWTAAHQYRPDNFFNGEVGKAYNLRFATTTRALIFAGAGAAAADVYTTYAGLGPWAFGKASIEDLRFTAVSPTPDHADALGRTWKLGYYMDFGSGVLDSTKFLRMESTATAV